MNRVIHIWEVRVEALHLGSGLVFKLSAGHMFDFGWVHRVRPWCEWLARISEGYGM